MVAMTETAGELLQQVQTTQGFSSTLRMETDASGLIIGVSEPQPDDEVLFHDGQPVLRLSADAAAALAGCTITTEESPEGTQLAILPPAGQ